MVLSLVVVPQSFNMVWHGSVVEACACAATPIRQPRASPVGAQAVALYEAARERTRENRRAERARKKLEKMERRVAINKRMDAERAGLFQELRIVRRARGRGGRGAKGQSSGDGSGGDCNNASCGASVGAAPTLALKRLPCRSPPHLILIHPCKSVMLGCGAVFLTVWPAKGGARRG